jgi:hypothetical protein
MKNRKAVAIVYISNKNKIQSAVICDGRPVM